MVKLTDFEKGMIKQMIHAKKKPYFIAKKFKIHISTVYRLAKRKITNRSIHRVQGSGRPKKYSKRLENLIVMLIKTSLCNSAADVKRTLIKSNLTSLSVSTIRRIL